MKIQPLGDVCEINPRIDKDLSPTDECSFIPMEYVDDRSGTVVCTNIKRVEEVCKGYTFFRNGDVLFAKITPCMENGKSAVAKNLVNGIGFGSTEFHVIRARQSVTPDWVFYFLRQDTVRRRAARRMTGSAGQKRVSAPVVAELEIPIVPIDEQKRVTAILKKADRLRRSRTYTRQLAESLLQSIFLDMFGDTARNPMRWKAEKLSSLGELDRGRSRHRPRNASALYGGPYPFIQTGEIANSDGYIRSFRQTYSETGLKQSKMWPRGTLCITIAANIAKTGILTFDACFPDSVVGFSPNDKTTTEFVRQWFSFVQKNLEKTAPESAQKNINLEILRRLHVPVPPIELQQQFTEAVRRFERMRVRQREAERQAEHLFQTLLHRAFCGEHTVVDHKAKTVFASHSPVAKKQAPKAKPDDNVLPIAAVSRPAARSAKHSKGSIFYRRAAVDCYVMQGLRGDANLGRTKMEKISHLIEYHCRINLEREPVRDAAGPNDFPSRMKVESLARKQQWYFTSQHSDHGRVRYRPGPNIEKSRSTAERFLGKYKRAVDELLSIMRPLDTEQSEIVATLYAAWNDFLLAGQTPSDTEIVAEVRNNWDPRKQRFTEERYRNALQWIRKKGLVPRGVGRAVTHKHDVAIS